MNFIFIASFGEYVDLTSGALQPSLQEYVVYVKYKYCVAV